VKCLVLACGNPLRGDDGVGILLARFAEEWAAERRTDIKIIARMQWTPELAEDIAAAESVIFIDCAVDLKPGEILVREVAADADALPATHHLQPYELLALARDLYNRAPKRAILFTVGAASVEMGEELSAQLEAALPEARLKLEKALESCID
jgi:hydrogenase maturation protease